MAVPRRAAWTLFILGGIYVIGELGHFLVGVVSRETAREIHYGDLACYPIEDLGNETVEFKFCETAVTKDDCTNLTTTPSPDLQVCKWDYSGLGLEYQLLAGPSFIFVFTLMGMFWGYAADHLNRVWLLTAAAVMFSLSLVGASFATKYWHLVISRMFLAAGESGCSPLAAGMISDMFPLKQRAFAMSLFNWGIYIGYGFSYAIGTYVPAADILDQGWRAAFFVSGVPGVVLALVFFLTVRDPPRTGNPSESAELSKEELNAGNNDSVNSLTVDEAPSTEMLEKKGENVSLLDVARNPLIILLGLAACIRHSAGFCWGYNSAQYFQKYYPDYTEAGWWLMGISIGGGTVGAAIGGFVSDRLVKNYGIPARAIVLAGSQLLATPFSVGLLYLDPPYAFFSLLCGYLCAEMWFGVMFAILMELVPSSLRSTALGIGLFLINNIGGNVPILVHYVSSAINRPSGFRTAITIFYTGTLFTSSLLFFALYVALRRRKL